MPELYKHIKTLNIPWSCLIMKWFICLYAEVLPTEVNSRFKYRIIFSSYFFLILSVSLLQTVLRVWDCVFYEGCKVLFRVGVTLINHHQKSLLDCNNFTSFTDFFKKMQSDIFVLDCHNFMKVILQLSYFVAYNN